MKLRQILASGSALITLSLLTGCAIYRYPGQPGMKTDDMARIDFEDLQYDGLWTYEVRYDNTAGGTGVAAIVSYFYPNAQTNTSNVRTNSEGTLYRHEEQLQGAEIQAISIPRLNQVIMPRNSQVWLFLGYARSMNEIDTRNIAEDGIFSRSKTHGEQPISKSALDWMRTQQKMLTMGTIDWKGNIVYNVERLTIDGKIFTPQTPVRIESNLFSSATRVALTAELKASMIDFIHANFPRGYAGTVQLHLVGATEDLPFDVSLHTPQTFEQAGGVVIRNATKETLDQTLAALKSSK